MIAVLFKGSFLRSSLPSAANKQTANLPHRTRFVKGTQKYSFRYSERERITRVVTRPHAKQDTQRLLAGCLGVEVELELILERKLDLPRNVVGRSTCDLAERTRLDTVVIAWLSDVPIPVARLTAARIVRYSEGIRCDAQGIVWIGEVRCVHDVEGFYTELKAGCFIDREGLEDRKVNLTEVRSVQ